MVQLSPAEKQVVAATPVARLATADASGAPHVVPVCFYFDGQRFYSPLDQKPKRAPIKRLRRVRNILENPRVSLVIDYYQEDWTGLWYVLVRGEARLVHPGPDQAQAVEGLRQKYPQYLTMDIDSNPVIAITPTSIVRWGEPGVRR